VKQARTVLIGGDDGNGGTADAWILLKEGTWTQGPLPPPAFAPRCEHAAVYDGERILVIGGHDGGNAWTDMWQLDEKGWSPVAGALPGTPGRYQHGAAFDKERGRVVVFGGWDASNVRRGDTSEYVVVSAKN
jgi:hypothetical protein